GERGSFLADGVHFHLGMSFFNSRISRFNNEDGIESSFDGKYLLGTNRWRNVITLAHRMIKATNWISSIERSGAVWRLGASRPSAPTRIGFLPWSRIADLSVKSHLQDICGIRTRHEVRRLSVVRRKRLLRLIDTPAD